MALAAWRRRRPRRGRRRAGRRRGGGGRWRCRASGRPGCAPGSGRRSLGDAGVGPMIAARPSRPTRTTRSGAAVRSPRWMIGAPPATGRRLLTAELLSIGIRADRRRDARHERRRAGPVADRAGRPGDAGSRPCPTISPRSPRPSRPALGAGRPGRLDRRPRPDAGRPDPRGDRRGLSARRRRVDPDLEAWLRELWARRDMPFPELNLKQAWLIPSADGAAEPERDGARLVRRRGPTAGSSSPCPGPPREMRPMWADEVVPRLERARARGGGRVADLPAGRDRRVAGRRAARRDRCCRATEPDRRDLCPGRGGRRPDLGRGRCDRRRPRSSWRRPRASRARGRSATTSGRPARRPGATAIGERLDELGWTLAVVEIGTGGSSPRSSATSPGSASTRRSPPTPRRARARLAGR